MIANTISALIALFVLVKIAAAGDIAFTTTRKGEAFELEGRVTMAVSRDVVWQTVTDYEHLADFIPALHKSQVVWRAANRLILEQRGELRLLFFSFPIEVRLAVEERPPGVIVSRAIAGTVRSMYGRYDLFEAQGGTEFRYHGQILADFGLPAFISELMLHAYAEAHFSALVREIERRGARRNRP